MNARPEGLHRRRAALTQAERDIAAEMRERGLSCGRIARKLKCSEGAVSWAMLAMGVDPHADRTLPPVPTEPIIQYRASGAVRRFTIDEDDVLLSLEAQGLSANAIGKRLGRKANSVTGRLRTLARRAERELTLASRAA